RGLRRERLPGRQGLRLRAPAAARDRAPARRPLLTRARVHAEAPAPSAPATGSLVAGVDSSTQSCKVVVRDAATGDVVRTGRASHPDGSEVDPAHWWRALREALDDAG